MTQRIKGQDVRIMPTAGRIVHYQPTESQVGYASPDAGGVIPAMVTGLNAHGAANLYLFPNCGAGAMWVGNITEGGGPGKWRWPTRDDAPKKSDDDTAKQPAAKPEDDAS